MKIKIKVKEDRLPQIISKGDWIDLANETKVELNGLQKTVCLMTENGQVFGYDTEYKQISLGVAMQLPKGFEAIVVARSSTFKKYGIFNPNALGVIDNSYCGNNDIWQLPVISIKPTTIPANTRICQFRIQLSQKANVWQKLRWLFTNKIEFERVDILDTNTNRGGFGSTDEN